MSLIELKQFRITLDSARRLNVNLKLNAGEALRISGKSGGGKTTLMRAIALLNPRSGGEIFFRGKESKDYLPWVWRRNICYLAQKPVMLPGTVEENLKITSRLKISDKIFDRCDKCPGLMEKLGLDSDILSRDASVISGGEAARVALSRALLTEPSILIADEITAPLDEANAARAISVIAEWLKSGDRALIYSAHQERNWTGIAYRDVNIEDFRE